MDGITDSMDDLSKLEEMGKDREGCPATIPGFAKN